MQTCGRNRICTRLFTSIRPRSVWFSAAECVFYQANRVSARAVGIEDLVETCEVGTYERGMPPCCPSRRFFFSFFITFAKASRKTPCMAQCLLGRNSSIKPVTRLHSQRPYMRCPPSNYNGLFRNTTLVQTGSRVMQRAVKLSDLVKISRCVAHPVSWHNTAIQLWLSRFLRFSWLSSARPHYPTRATV